MYCQKCYKEVPSGYVCPHCRYNNSPNLTQPNILYGINKSRGIPMFVDAEDYSVSFKDRLLKFKDKLLG